MTDEDKNLLELAAKAAGLKNYRYCPAEDGLHACIEFDDEDDCTVVWMPHLDDGDALRLAAKLNLSICYTLGDINAPWGTALVGFSPWENASPIAAVRYQTHEEKMVATRRAITRAAAEIGKVQQQ